MDALEFAKQKRRMCRSHPTCTACELQSSPCSPCNLGYTHQSIEYDEKIIKTVEKWASEHPERTRQSEFLKIFPTTPIDNNGVIHINPCEVDETEEDNCMRKTCIDCRREFWLAPLEEE